MICRNSLRMDKNRMFLLAKYNSLEIELAKLCRKSTISVFFQHRVNPRIANATLPLNPIKEAEGRVQISQVLLSTSG